MADFYTTLTSNDYGVKDCAQEVFNQLLRTDAYSNPPPIQKENLVFVTHSTGGILARYILEAWSDNFTEKKIGLCLYASPSFGSKLSSRLGAVFSFFNHKLAQELQWGSSILEDLDGRFFGLLDAGKLAIAGMEAYENKAPFKIPFLSARVVQKESAARYFGARTLIANSDHSSIVKPETLSCQSHEILLDFLTRKDFIKQAGQSSFDRPSLFDRYSPEYEDFFIVRTVDSELDSLLGNYSIWVCGESGVGKTASITRSLDKRNIKPFYISLGACIGASFNELLNEIYLTLLNDDEQDIPQLSDKECVKRISNLIKKQSEKPFYLFIEEIPINNEKMFLHFSNFIYAIIMSVNDSANFRIVLSSIYCPNTKLEPEMKKVSEKLKIYVWPTWNDDDMTKLAQLIETDTGIEIMRAKPLSDFQGVPRKMKIYCRDQLSKA
ncbi:hypothetical protein [Microbulbifer sp. ZKSA002]|uniref:hypothetical protein n=1 Tax=Microbulbifer sp. ZKSA002 TaxID=3243388 RepID=UPI004039733A